MKVFTLLIVCTVLAACGPRHVVQVSNQHVIFQPVSVAEIDVAQPTGPLAFREISLSVPQIGASLGTAATKYETKSRGVLLSSLVDGLNYVLESDIHAEISPHFDRLVDVDPSSRDSLSVNMKVSISGNVEKLSWGRQRARYTVRVRFDVVVRRAAKKFFVNRYSSTDSFYSSGQKMSGEEFSKLMKVAYIRAYKKLATKFPKDLARQQVSS